MYNRAEFVEYLPRLRRYARALTGNQETGDQLVIAVLRRTGQMRHANDANSKAVLFRVLCTLWNGLFGEQMRSATTERYAVNSVDYRLGKLQHLSRQAFLLVALEDFSQEVAAEILQVSQAEFEDILVEALAEVSTQVSTDVLIIEDKSLVAAELKRIMLELGHSVFKITTTRAEALAAMEDMKPGLILADIKLADDCNESKTVNEILIKHSIPIVFVAACRDDIPTDLRPVPNFFIAKPFEKSVVRGVVNQALFFNEKAYRRDSKAEQALSLMVGTR